MVVTVVWTLVPCHSFDSDSSNSKYSADFLRALCIRIQIVGTSPRLSISIGIGQA